MIGRNISGDISMGPNHLIRIWTALRPLKESRVFKETLENLNWKRAFAGNQFEVNLLLNFVYCSVFL